MSDISDVDAFDQQQEKLLLEQSMRGDRRRQYDHMEMSDEEVMGFKPSDSEEEEDDDDEILDRDQDDDGEAQEAWGKGELYGADDIEDEEDRKLEAEEALKLQKKQAKQMKESDFLGEWAADDSDDEDEEDVDIATAGKGVRESIPVKPIESMSSKEQYDQLVRLNPELILMNAELAKVTEEMVTLEKAEEDEEEEPEIVEIKKTALRTYIGVLNAYFALFMDSVQNGKANMKDHIIMEAILKAREMWRMAQEIGLPEEDVDEMASDEEMVSEGAELMDVSDAESDVSDDLDLSRFRRRPEEDLEEVEEEEEEVDSEDELALPTSFKAKKSKSKISAVPDYGEHAINDVDQADKDRRKRDLRFYTAKIDKQARGREQEEIEGDADLPYQDRWYERQQQLKEKQAAHIKDSGEHDLFDSGDEGASADDYQEMPSKKNAGGDDDEDVDDFVAALKAKKQQRKAEREAMHEVYLDAKKGKIDVDKLDDNGKRAINYQILKNKGLTPHRKKENRNSRVKKRIKYDKAKKKLASTRAVYKQPTSAYAGEKTGIKKNLARSTKFRE